MGHNFKSSLKTCHQLSWNLHRDAYHLAPLGNWEKHWPHIDRAIILQWKLRTPNEELEFLMKKHNAWWQTKIPFYLMTRKLHFVIPFVLLLKISLVFYMPFKSLNKLCKNVGPKSFCFTKPTCFDISSSNFNLQNHILSTIGDDLRNQFHKGQHNLINFWKKGKERKFWKKEVLFCLFGFFYF